MTYAVKQDLIDRIGLPELVQLTDRTNMPPVSVDDAVLNRALADADAEINAFLAVRLSLPLASVPLVLTRVACDIARYRLYDDRATEQVRQRYHDAIAYLGRIAAGSASLGIDAANATVATPNSAEVATAAERVFTRNSLADYAQ